MANSNELEDTEVRGPISVEDTPWREWGHGRFTGRVRHLTRRLGRPYRVGVLIEELQPGIHSCPASGRSCLATNDWSGGWVVFDDVDADRRVGAAERVVKSVAAPGGNVRLRTSAGRIRLVFQPNGGNSGSNATFVLCDGRGPDKAVAIVLSNEGRIRTAKPAAADAQNCVHAP